MKSLLAVIHVKKKSLSLDDDIYRDLLERITGVRSAGDMTEQQRLQVIAEMDRQGAASAGPRRSLRADRVSGRYAGILRALWLTGYNLGIIRDNRDSALIAFVERQTGLSHTAWLNDPHDAARAIEALKKWIEREGQVKLTSRSADDRREAVIERQLELLGLASLPEELTDAADDEVIGALGRQIRAGRARK
ncbi:phage protein GemA/Gp16 family protein [Pannonibacter indicus]|uniref:phage protein GemA/Gp16 family protein n=1 Tax=Pannonibacter indicus TaxID=466044 RepID=UPI00391B8A30